jgi:hypothetical protein
MPSENYGVFCSTGWCEINNMNGRGSKDQAEKMLEYYASRPLGGDNKYIVCLHTASCSKRYPRCCTPRIRIDEFIIVK